MLARRAAAVVALAPKQSVELSKQNAGNPGALPAGYGVTLMPFGPSPTRTLATTFADLTSSTETEFS